MYFLSSFFPSVLHCYSGSDVVASFPGQFPRTFPCLFLWKIHLSFYLLYPSLFYFHYCSETLKFSLANFPHENFSFLNRNAIFFGVLSWSPLFIWLLKVLVHWVFCTFDVVACWEKNEMDPYEDRGGQYGKMLLFLYLSLYSLAQITILILLLLLLLFCQTHVNSFTALTKCADS